MVPGESRAGTFGPAKCKTFLSVDENPLRPWLSSAPSFLTPEVVRTAPPSPPDVVPRSAVEISIAGWPRSRLSRSFDPDL